MDVSEAAEVDEKSTHAKQDEDSVADDKAQHENEDKEIKIETGSLKKENHKEEKELKKEVKLVTNFYTFMINILLWYFNRCECKKGGSQNDQ